jgi:hypothetical protein
MFVDLIEDEGLVNTFVCNSGLDEEQTKAWQKFLDTCPKTISGNIITYHISIPEDYIEEK